MKPWLWLPPKLAHDLSPIGIQICSLLYEKRTPEWGSFSWRGLRFKNRLGLAGGADKNGQSLNAWERLGCGFIELGTVTPFAQDSNPGKIIDRSSEDLALWNKMGFPSLGADECFYNLRNFKDDSSVPILVNIGKNRTTANDLAFRDYCYLIERFHDLADAFVVNISSPNTAGLRQLADRETLAAFLKPIAQTRNEFENRKPILLKLSPDMTDDQLKTVLDISVENDMDGFVLTNTTLSRETKKTFPSEGGVSGAPVASLSKKALVTAISHLGNEKTKKLVISVGGVMTTEDVFERLSLGADLVEVYTALIYSGPNFFRKVEKTVNESGQSKLF
jgi:dihydroorotate dehydrogenase